MTLYTMPLTSLALIGSTKDHPVLERLYENFVAYYLDLDYRRFIYNHTGPLVPLRKIISSPDEVYGAHGQLTALYSIIDTC